MALGGCSKPADAPKPTEAIIEGLGSHHMAVTATPEAQRLFDQGLRLAYAFNHPEAERSFRAAAALDPSCAMCWWGTALVLGPNINLPMDPAAAAPAWEALAKARAGAAKVSDRERAYIEALTARYADPAPANRAPLDSAYSRAMAQVAQQFPSDLDAQVLYAESLMDLSPWNYWDAKGQPNPGLDQLVPILERTIAADSMHPGACHYYIHAVEKVKPALAVPCAERLASLMPAAGHLVHMPAHIYARVGRYNDAVDANVHAVHADQAFISDRPGQQSVYLALYYPHNYHFLAFASALAGRSQEAITAATAASEHTPFEVAQLAVEAEYVVPAKFVYLATYGRWDDILSLTLPPDTLHAARGMALYARGSALAAKGRGAEASATLDTVQALAKVEPAGVRKLLLEISSAMLAGNIAQQDGNLAKAISAYQRAAAAEDSLPYMEPAFWHHPTRLALGAALLKAKPAEGGGCRLSRGAGDVSRERGGAVRPVEESRGKRRKDRCGRTRAPDRGGVEQGGYSARRRRSPEPQPERQRANSARLIAPSVQTTSTRLDSPSARCLRSPPSRGSRIRAAIAPVVAAPEVPASSAGSPGASR